MTGLLGRLAVVLTAARTEAGRTLLVDVADYGIVALRQAPANLLVTLRRGIVAFLAIHAHAAVEDGHSELDAFRALAFDRLRAEAWFPLRYAIRVSHPFPPESPAASAEEDALVGAAAVALGHGELPPDAMQGDGRTFEIETPFQSRAVLLASVVARALPPGGECALYVEGHEKAIPVYPELRLVAAWRAEASGPIRIAGDPFREEMARELKALRASVNERRTG